MKRDVILVSYPGSDWLEMLQVGSGYTDDRAHARYHVFRRAESEIAAFPLVSLVYYLPDPMHPLPCWSIEGRPERYFSLIDVLEKALG